MDIGTSDFLTYKNGVAEGPGWSRQFYPVSGTSDRYEPVSCQYSTTFSMSNGIVSGEFTEYYADNTTIPGDKHCTIFSIEQR